jgi:hypothetical protein
MFSNTPSLCCFLIARDRFHEFPANIFAYDDYTYRVTEDAQSAIEVCDGKKPSVTRSM